MWSCHLLCQQTASKGGHTLYSEATDWLLFFPFTTDQTLSGKTSTSIYRIIVCLFMILSYGASGGSPTVILWTAQYFYDDLVQETMIRQLDSCFLIKYVLYRYVEWETQLTWKLKSYHAKISDLTSGLLLKLTCCVFYGSIIWLDKPCKYYSQIKFSWSVTRILVTALAWSANRTLGLIIDNLFFINRTWKI